MTAAHSFFPSQSHPTLFAMAGDDCSLYFDLEQLTPKQQADHVSNVELTAMLQVAHLYMGKPADHVAMFNEFQSAPWQDALRFYHDCFAQMGTRPIRWEHIHYHPREGFYESVAASAPEVDSTTLYLLSGSNTPLHRSEAALAVSRSVNSKMVLARNAAKYDIPVPETLVARKADLGTAEVAGFFERHGEVMLKIMGLAGARNVTSVASQQAAADYLAEYEDGLEIVLQRKLAANEFTEMTVDLLVSDTAIEIANVRRILFADGLWVGNLIGGSVEVNDAQREVLLRVGAYARDLGYTDEQPLNCGIDYFVSPTQTLITEINARWTGGLFPAEMTKRLDLGDTDVVAFFDTVTRAGFSRYQRFVADHLHPRPDQPFANVPIGFSPFPLEIDGAEHLFLWHMVVGDVEAFKAAKRAALGAADLPTADKLSLVV